MPGCSESLDELGAPTTPAVASFLEHGPEYVATVDAVVRFLPGRDPGFALRIVGRDLLPEGPRFAATLEGPGADEDDPLAWAFGGLGIADRAKHLASLYIDDLADAIRDGIAPDFELARYAERLAASAPTFDPLHDALEGKPTLIDTMLDELAAELYARHRPDVVGLTVPFPGNAYSGFRIARAIKAIAPATRTILGGGYVNTELRGLTEPRVFDYFDFITLDAGEAPLLALLEHLRDPSRPLLHVRANRRAGRARHRTATPRRAHHRDRHADLRRPRARSLRLAVRDAQPDASAVVRRPVEQAHRRAWLLLEAVHVLRCLARLHRALRSCAGGSARRSHRGVDRRDRPERVSLRRRGGPAGGARGARRAVARARRDHHVVGQRAVREGIHAGARAAARALGCRCAIAGDARDRYRTAAVAIEEVAIDDQPGRQL